MIDTTKHLEDCPFVVSRDPAEKKRRKAKQWFDLMGVKNNCPLCGVALEFSDDEK